MRAQWPNLFLSFWAHKMITDRQSAFLEILRQTIRFEKERRVRSVRCRLRQPWALDETACAVCKTASCANLLRFGICGGDIFPLSFCLAIPMRIPTLPRVVSRARISTQFHIADSF
jgi:hypothetical protein